MEEEIKKKRLVKLNWQGNDFPIYAQIYIHKDKHISKALAELVNMISEGAYC